jgi:hypothetical protein
MKPKRNRRDINPGDLFFDSVMGAMRRGYDRLNEL